MRLKELREQRNELNYQLAQGEEVVLAKLLDDMKSTGEEYTAYELSYLTNEEMTPAQLQMFLRYRACKDEGGYPFWSSRQAINHFPKTVKSRREIETKTFAEIDKNGNIIRGGREINLQQSVTYFKVENKDCPLKDWERKGARRGYLPDKVGKRTRIPVYNDED